MEANLIAVCNRRPATEYGQKEIEVYSSQLYNKKAFMAPSKRGKSRSAPTFQNAQMSASLTLNTSLVTTRESS
jgi:hypothetical protein